MTKSTGEDWVGVPALSKELGVTMRTLYKLLDAGDLPAYKLGRVIRVKRADVEQFLERSKVRPGELAHLYAPGGGWRPAMEAIGASYTLSHAAHAA